MKPSIFTNFLRGLVMLANAVPLVVVVKDLLFPIHFTESADWILSFVAIVLFSLNIVLIGESIYSRVCAPKQNQSRSS